MQLQRKKKSVVVVVVVAVAVRDEIEGGGGDLKPRLRWHRLANRGIVGSSTIESKRWFANRGRQLIGGSSGGQKNDGCWSWRLSRGWSWWLGRGKAAGRSVVLKFVDPKQKEPRSEGEDVIILIYY
ncbi:hypothetical protein ACFE04_025835 [Oxalis oulophora]